MRYPEFRRQHLFVGSGVIEAGCKTVIGSPLKQSGMFWTPENNAIIALRCCQLNNRFEDYWVARRPRLDLHFSAPLVLLGCKWNLGCDVMYCRVKPCWRVPDLVLSHSKCSRHESSH
jgi:hypothetical protein